MSVYFISACHKCKEQIQWSKCLRRQAELWHKEFSEKHLGHEVQMSTDMDDEFYDRIYHYNDLGIKG